MKDQILSRFVACSPDPNNPAGVATYTYCGKTFEMPMPSFTRARELEQFIGHVIGNARRIQREAMAAQMRGALNTMESDS